MTVVAVDDNTDADSATSSLRSMVILVTSIYGAEKIEERNMLVFAIHGIFDATSQEALLSQKDRISALRHLIFCKLLYKSSSTEKLV